MRLVADANVLLSALIGGRARAVFTHPRVQEILTTPGAVAEVHEYLPHLAARKRLPLDALLLAMATLSVTIVERPGYAPRIAEASRRIGTRDPDDVELLALALHLKLPIWSNDDDFREARGSLYTTAELLRELGIRSRR